MSYGETGIKNTSLHISESIIIPEDSDNIKINVDGHNCNNHDPVNPVCLYFLIVNTVPGWKVFKSTLLETKGYYAYKLDKCDGSIDVFIYRYKPWFGCFCC